MYMTRAKRAGELFHIDVIGFISFIGHNRARFIVYNINNIFRIHFKKCIKEKEKAPKIFYIWATYFKNYIRYNIQHIHLNNSKKYTKLGI